MINIIDTLSQIDAVFDNGIFNMEKWEAYINSIYDNSADIFKNDLKECLTCSDYTFEKDILPVINAVHGCQALETLHASFNKATKNLNERIINCFGQELDIDIVLYIGLCNAAGWVTRINSRNVILLRIEKILELKWYEEDAMYGLIYHELGHVYHKQYGTFYQNSDDSNRNFVWQLFAEGIAMYFEQALLDDFKFYHQDVNGWKAWCDGSLDQIKRDFTRDLDDMTFENQRYFGDWVFYRNHSDVGYFLGAKFVRFISGSYPFDEILSFDIGQVRSLFDRFVQ